jgi:hypothetical protein
MRDSGATSPASCTTSCTRIGGRIASDCGQKGYRAGGSLRGRRQASRTTGGERESGQDEHAAAALAVMAPEVQRFVVPMMAAPSQLIATGPVVLADLPKD